MSFMTYTESTIISLNPGDKLFRMKHPYVYEILGKD